MKHFLSKVPIPTAAVSLGLAALGNLLQSISEGLRIFCGTISFLLLLLVIAKIIFCLPTVKKELENPVLASVSATFFMTIMQLSTYVKFLGPIALVIWAVAVTGHFILIGWFTKRMLSRFKLEDIFPTYFVTYVGIIVASITSSTFGLEAIGRIIFIFGFSAYVVMFILVTYRYFKHEVHESHKPLFCIYTAPMSLSIAGYMAVFEQKSLILVITMGLLAQILFLVVLTQLPKFLRSKFYPSFAAFTFPFVITATALKQVVSHIGEYYTIPNWMTYLLIIETIIAVLLIIYTVVHYLVYLYSHLPHLRKQLESGNKLENGNKLGQ